MNKTVWDRRFKQRKMEPLLESFNASIGEDRFLWEAEVRASKAYARGLHEASVLNDSEFEDILRGLETVKKKIEGGEDLSRFEDVHTAVELLVVEEIGEAGKKLHTGRSRNEQVATDERLYLKERVREAVVSIVHVQAEIVRLAEASPDLVMPAFTHFRPAQCILFSHYILSFFWPLERQKARLNEALHRIDTLPLGSGALAGTTTALNRHALKEFLGFSRISENSLDAVTDRSYILEVLFAFSLTLLDLSRLAEDLILLSTPEFGYFELDDTLTTSSSLMPQKKNPDILELLRAGPAKLFACLTELFTAVKGLPSGYNKDLQSDKAPLYRGVEDALGHLRIARIVLARVKPSPAAMSRAIKPCLFATDLVDYLTVKGIPFREAHGIIGEVVAFAETSGKSLSQVGVEELREFHPAFDKDVYGVFDPDASVRSKKTSGSTNPDMVRLQLEKAKQLVGMG